MTKRFLLRDGKKVQRTRQLNPEGPDLQGEGRDNHPCPHLQRIRERSS